MNTLKDEWEEFARRILPIGISRIQYTEMRKAFYAGAAILFKLITTDVTDESIEGGDDVGVQRLEDIYQELCEFVNIIDPTSNVQ